VLLSELKPEVQPELKTGRIFAVKILRKLDMSTYTKHRTQLERQIMERVDHPFIAGLKVLLIDHPFIAGLKVLLR
jgi:hypothetical protein